ncbi:MAG TPA: HlyD family efflux transporter periplasmic adaptor subunit [Planctomycetaceae bacterium]|nr:HlyD family efflux transporter periplasmic adaptor subunit [Planctomycetaceae bacterium]
MSKRLVAAAVVTLLLTGLLVWSQQRRGPLKVSGFIEADEIRLGSRVGGRVARVHVMEGQAVRVGEALVELEPFQLRELLAQARGEVARAQAELDRVSNGFRPEEIAQAKAKYNQWEAVVRKLTKGPREEDIAVAEKQYQLAEAELKLAMLKHQRTESLFAKQAATTEDLDRTATELRVARATLETRQEELGKLQKGTREEDLDEAKAQLDEANQVWQLRQRGFRDEEKSQARAAVESAAAAVQVIERQLDELVIKAPVDGSVEAIELQPGDLVGANSPAISLMDSSHLWVRAFVPENRLSLKVGDAVNVTVDSYPGERFAGRISFVSRQAEFTPGNVQTPDDRSQQVFRIKVALEAGRERLRPGMSADVWLGQ